MNEENLKKYGIIEVTKYEIGCTNFNNLISDHLPKLVNKSASDRYKNFESVAEFEWDNDSNYDCDVRESDIEKDSWYDKRGRSDVMNGKYIIGFHSILCFLVENKIIPLGNYEVKVSW